MELLLILTYSAICVAVFKIFRIPVNKWTLPTAALGGIFLLSGILLVMNYNHPFTQNARIYFATTPIMPRGNSHDRRPSKPGSIRLVSHWPLVAAFRRESDRAGRIRYATESRIKKAKGITP